MPELRVGIRNVSRNSDMGSVKDLLDEIAGFLANFVEVKNTMTILIDGVEVLSLEKGDQKAGVGMLGNYNLNIFTNNTNRMTIAKDGKVGIGTESPDFPLELRTNGENAAFVCRRIDGATGYMNTTSSYGNFGTASNHSVRIMVNSTPKVIVDANGDVFVAALKSAESHPTNYKALFVDTDTGRIYSKT